MISQADLDLVIHDDLAVLNKILSIENILDIYVTYKGEGFFLDIRKDKNLFRPRITTLRIEKESPLKRAHVLLEELKKIIEQKEAFRLKFLLGEYTWKEVSYRGG
jgi:hypothetical protein